MAAPTYKRLIAEFTGQEAHAGINPEDGHSAIAAAAAAVAEMKLGRLDEETTANVGIIEGGTASNVVAGHCRILGEARSVDGEKAATKIGEMVDACTWAAGEQGCDVDAQVIEMFRGYRLDPKSDAVRIASDALRRTGQEPELVATGGGSDANALVASGYDAVLLANGTEANHTPAGVGHGRRDRGDARRLRGGARRGGEGGCDDGRGIDGAEAAPGSRDGGGSASGPGRGEERAAWADESLVGEIRKGDELILNTEAQDLGLGSGGFDVVHVNLTRGLNHPGAEEATAMKLNYTSLQHPVDPVETREHRGPLRRIPVLVLSLHGQLAPAAWAAGARPRYSGSATSRPQAAPCRASSRRTSPSCVARSCSTATSRLAPAYGGELRR